MDGTLADADGNNALTSHGDPDLASAGYTGRAAGLGDPQDHLSGTVPADTSKNFSLSAWAKVDDGGADRAVVAAGDGTAFSAGLYFDAAAGRWAFGMTTPDRTGLRVAHSQAQAETGVWTHLAGTYEFTTRTLTLYVDGVRQGQVTGVDGWQASQLLVGRHRWNGAEVGGAPGAVDELKVYARTVNEDEVRQLAGQASLRGHHRFNEGTGAGTQDEVTGTVAPLSGKTGWEVDGDDTSLRLNGPDESGQEQDGEAYVSGAAPGIRTDRSFSISAWARLDTDAHDGKDRTVVSLVRDGSSLLDLRYSGASKKWEFVFGGTTVRTAYRAELQEWTYLTAVHDKAKAEVRLYFNAIYVTSVPFTGGSAETGSTVEFGRLSPATAAGSFWKGGIDDVRVYAGVLSEQQIVAQAIRT
ncbi:LamG domain-containing protein [Lentzea sp. NPDC003310]|uniref:LamG domain-containing protein n=1 Tax=Lentzea sp. NPDC003310 TaxID=3154447 RepID=UPI0033AA8078